MLANRSYRGPVAVFALSFAVMMAYISASPFVYQNVVGLSEVGYGMAFGVNAVGLIAAGWVTSRLVDRWSPPQLVRTAIAVQVAACAGLRRAGRARRAGLDLPDPDLRRGRLQRRDHGQRRGAGDGARCGRWPAPAARSSGFSQFALGAVVSPLVGLGGEPSALVPALVMATASAIGFTVSRVSLRR